MFSSKARKFIFYFSVGLYIAFRQLPHCLHPIAFRSRQARFFAVLLSAAYALATRADAFKNRGRRL